jgi:signal transduction histidine kinase
MPDDGRRPPDHLVDVDGTCQLSRGELEVRAKALRTVNAITDAVFSTSDPQEVVRRAVDAIARFTRFPAIAIYELNEPARRVDLLYGVGFAEATLQAGAHLPLDGSLTGVAVQQGQVVLSPDVSRDARVEPIVRQRLVEEGFSSIASVPLVLGQHVLGAINLIYKGELGLTPAEHEMLASLGKAIAMAVDRAHHVRRIERERRDARDTIAVRDEFLNVASHELRTPLTALQLDLESMDRAFRARGAPAVLEKVGRAREQARRLMDLCEGLVDVSRLSSMGCVVLELEPCDLRAIVAGAASRHQVDAERKRCRIVLPEGSRVEGVWDRRRLDRVFSILLANAIKYGAGYPIELAVDASGSHASASVTDHGIGIAPQDAARIFERFERAAPSQNYGGLGLGLYVAREIVHAHGGSILVSSEPGAGATFTVLLPLWTATKCT